MYYIVFIYIYIYIYTALMPTSEYNVRSCNTASRDTYTIVSTCLEHM